MGNRSFVAFVGIALVIQSAIDGAAWAGRFADCVRDAASRDLVAKTELQRDLRDLVVQKRPEFGSLATVNMKLQILLAEAQRARLDYLITHEPDRIDTANGLGQFRNFEWSDEDSARRMKESKSYYELESRISTLKERNNDHPSWPKLREYVRSELGRSPDFKALMARFQARQGDLKAVIAQCHHD